MAPADISPETADLPYLPLIRKHRGGGLNESPQCCTFEENLAYPISLKKMVRKRIFTILGIVAFLAVTAGIWLGYQYLSQPALPPLNAVPTNAIALLQVNGPALLWEKLARENQIWASLRKTSTFDRISQVIHTADSALHSDEDLHRIFEHKELIISLNPVNDTAADFLFILQLPVPFPGSSVGKFISHFGTPVKLSGNNDLNGVTFKGAHTPFFYYISNGLFVGSYHQQLLETSLNQLTSKQSLALDPAFAEVRRTAGKNVDANLFIQFSRLPGFLRSFSTRALVPGFEKLKNFARWSGLDLVVHPDQLLLSGFTRPMGSDFLKLFSNQKPGIIEGFQMLPETTANFAAFSFDDFNSFADSYNNYLSEANAGQASERTLISASTIQNLKDADLSEIIVAMTNTGLPTVQENSLVLVKSRNSDQLARMLNQTIPTALQKNVLSINGREIRAIRFGDFFGKFLNNVMPDFDQVYYFRLDDFFIFCPSSQNLHQLLMNYLTGQTLANNQAYQQFAEGLSGESNIYLYYNTSRSIAFHHYLFDDSTATSWDQSKAGLDDIEGVGLQFSGSDELSFTHIAIKQKTGPNTSSTRNPKQEPSTPVDSLTLPVNIPDTLSVADSLPSNPETLWEVEVDGNVLRQPYLVKAHRIAGKQAVMVFTENQRVAFIDPKGKLLWSLALDETPLGEIHSIDYFKNGKIQYLFNSRNYLYLIDANGKTVKPFPVKLPEPAAAPISVVTMKNGDYRIFCPSESLVVHAFKPDGSPDKTWQKPKTSLPIAGSLRYLKEGTRDYLIIPEANGNVMITNLKGEPVMNIRNSFTNSSHSTFYINETNSKGVMLTTDSEGNLVYIPASGAVEKTVFDNFSRDHIFVYGDFNRDGSNDFIYVDGPQLMVYDRFKNILLQYRFRRPVDTAPELFMIDGQSLLGVFCAPTSEIYLFDEKGLFRPQPFEGRTSFVVVKGHKLNPQHQLITASGNHVWSYAIKK